MSDEMDYLPAASGVGPQQQQTAADQHMVPAGLYGVAERPAGLSDWEYEIYLYQKEEELLRRPQESVAGDEAPEGRLGCVNTGLPGCGEGKTAGNTRAQQSKSCLQDSSLLRCLAQLDDDACGHVLLPKLWDVGAAGSVALTCTWLPELMQRNCRRLSFSYRTCRDSSTLDLDTHTEALPVRFPNCAEVHFEVGEEESYAQAAVLVPVLARLPKLDSVVLKTQYMLNNVGLVLLLRAMGQQLTQLRSLAIVAAACSGWRRARAAWEQLASIRQLTSLNLDLGLEPVNLADLGLLGQLTALEELVLVAPRAWWPYGRYKPEPEPVQQQQQDEDQGSDSESEQGSDSSREEQEHDLEDPGPEEQQQQQGPEQAEAQAQQRDRVGLYFLQRLQALTSLRLVMPSFTGLESGVSSCRQLKCLHLGAGLFPGAPPGWQPRLSTAQYEVLSSLTCLTKLLCGAIKVADMSVFYGAIKDLRHLDTLAPGFGTRWTLDALPVLAGLPRLSTVTGAWQKNDPAPGSSGGSQSSAVATYKCKSVHWLVEAAGAVPFSAFPHLEECALGGPITPSALASMAQHCRHLTAFGNVGDTWELSNPGLPTTLPQSAPVAARVAAIQSLSQLSSTLKRITFHADVYAELAALATATSSCQTLDKVVLVVPRGGDVSILGLKTHLARLSRPTALSLELPNMYLDHDAAVVLLSGLHPKMKLSLLLGSYEAPDIFYDAANQVESMGLARPQFRLSVCESRRMDDYQDDYQYHPAVMVPPPGAPWVNPTMVPAPAAPWGMLHMPMLVPWPHHHHDGDE